MIKFQKAIDSAKENAKSLITNAQDFVLEEVLISDNNKLYEVSLSYDIQGKNPLDGSQGNNQTGSSGLSQLAKLMSYRREFKTFFIDVETGQFKGFKNQKNNHPKWPSV